MAKRESRIDDDDRDQMTTDVSALLLSHAANLAGMDSRSDREKTAASIEAAVNAILMLRETVKMPSPHVCKSLGLDPKHHTMH